MEERVAVHKILQFVLRGVILHLDQQNVIDLHKLCGALLARLEKDAGLNETEKLACKTWVEYLKVHQPPPSIQ